MAMEKLLKSFGQYYDVRTENVIAPFVAQAEFHAHVVDLLGKTVQAAGELVPVDDPIAQGAIVGVALSEPAVVQHHQIHIQACMGHGIFYGIAQEITQYPPEQSAVCLCNDGVVRMTENRNQMGFVQLILCIIEFFLGLLEFSVGLSFFPCEPPLISF